MASFACGLHDTHAVGVCVAAHELQQTKCHVHAFLGRVCTSRNASLSLWQCVPVIAALVQLSHIEHARVSVPTRVCFAASVPSHERAHASVHLCTPRIGGCRESDKRIALYALFHDAVQQPVACQFPEAALTLRGQFLPQIARIDYNGASVCRANCYLQFLWFIGAIHTHPLRSQTWH